MRKLFESWSSEGGTIYYYDYFVEGGAVPYDIKPLGLMLVAAPLFLLDSIKN